VAEHGPVDGEQRGEVPPARVHQAVADGVDPAVHEMQPTPAQPHVDCRCAQTQREQLLARDHTALARGELGDPMVGGAFTVHVTV
jgi:hypothetical protein